MARHYLCPVHKKWLMLHPIEAIAHLEEVKAKGEYLRQNREWSEAHPYLMCAFEINETLLKSCAPVRSNLMLSYTAVAIMTADTLYKQHHSLDAADFLTEAAKQLQEIVDVSVMQQNCQSCAQQCIDALKNGAACYFDGPLNLSPQSEILH